MQLQNNILDKQYQDYLKTCDYKKVNLDELIQQYYKTGSQTCLDTLINSIQPLIVKLSLRYNKLGKLEVMDVIMEGNLIALDIIKKHYFNPDKKVKFITYIQFCLMNKISEYVLNNSAPAGLKTTQLEAAKFNAIRKIKSNAENYNISIDESLKQYNKKEGKKRGLTMTKKEFEEFDLGFISLNQEIGEDEDCCLSDFIKDNSSAANIENHIQNINFYDTLKNLLTKLQYNIIIDYYQEGYNIPEISKNYNITINTARKELNEARKIIKENKLKLDIRS